LTARTILFKIDSEKSFPDWEIKKTIWYWHVIKKTAFHEGKRRIQYRVCPLGKYLLLDWL